MLMCEVSRTSKALELEKQKKKEQVQSKSKEYGLPYHDVQIGKAKYHKLIPPS